MPLERELVSISLPADADLSASQFRAVGVNTDGEVVVVASAAAPAIGILQNKPGAAGVAAAVAIGGVSRMVAGAGGVQANDLVIATTAGAGIDGGATDVNVIGRALTSADAGEIFEVLIAPTTRVV